MASNKLITRPQQHLPPGPRGYPYVGVLPKMLRQPLRVLSRAAESYGGIAHLGLNCFLLAHPDHIKYVFQENHRNYSRGFNNIPSLKLFLGKGLPINDGEPWRRQRRLVQPVFQHKRIAAFADDIVGFTSSKLEHWQVSVASAEPLDIAEEMTRLTMQVIVKTMFSLHMSDAETSAIANAFSCVASFINLVTLPALPLWLPIPKTREFKRALQFLNQQVYRIIDQRRQAPDEHQDLLAMLLHAHDDDGSQMSDTQLRDEVMAIFIAGHDTTARVLTWALHLLSMHPEIEQKLQHEVDQVLGARPPTFEDIAALPYTRRVFEEALRLYSPVWLMDRKALGQDEIGGYTIPKGALLLISPYVTHRLPEFWDEPELFNPERFLPEAVAQRHRFAYVPFGGGHRYCIGTHFALMEGLLVLAMIAQRYRFRMMPGHRVELEALAFLRPKYGMLMVGEDRQR